MNAPTMLRSAWDMGKDGIWEYRVSGDDQIYYSAAEAWQRQTDLGYDRGARVDLRTNTQHSIIHVRPLGETEWGWHSGQRHRPAA